jgi:hypothetical protein
MEKGTEFMKKLVVLTDLGTFKAFRLEEDRLSSSPRLEPVDSYETVYGDDRISRRLSDQAGNFSKNSRTFAAVNDGATGERHNIHLEGERRSVAQIAERMGELLRDEQVESCYFAAANEINNRIIEALPPHARAKITKNVHSNLVNAQRDEVLDQFAKS